MFTPKNFFDLTQTAHKALFKDVHHVWEAIAEIKDYIKQHLPAPKIEGEILGAPHIGKHVVIGPNTIVEPGAYIMGPAWIGANCRIRHGAYIRENVIAGDECVLGNSCEFKNCLLFNEAQVPHFSYVGDSILGYKVHLGAGVILSNLKLDKTSIVVRHDNQSIDTGLKKFGAIIGDKCEIGCNAVINPGSILGKNSILYPGSIWKGVLPENSIARASIDYKILPRRGI
jgi:NDP-sugar pyrophosphorylase family protein